MMPPRIDPSSLTADMDRQHKQDKEDAEKWRALGGMDYWRCPRCGVDAHTMVTAPVYMADGVRLDMRCESCGKSYTADFRAVRAEPA